MLFEHINGFFDLSSGPGVRLCSCVKACLHLSIASIGPVIGTLDFKHRTGLVLQVQMPDMRPCTPWDSLRHALRM